MKPVTVIATGSLEGSEKREEREPTDIDPHREEWTPCESWCSPSNAALGLDLCEVGGG